MSCIIEVTVKNQNGKCAFKYKAGDKIVFDGKSIRGDIFYSALMVFLQKIFAMLYGVEFPWAEDKDVIFNACLTPTTPLCSKFAESKNSC
jgi:uncharacterized repeat protein (TIGR04076 family)